jgi:Ecdysteroid kinase-like family
MIRALATTDLITPEWLTEALRATGALPRGAVRTVEANENDAFNSTASHLTLTYTADAPADAPRQLFLKRNLAQEWAIEAARDEARFYQAAARLDPRPRMIVPCYLAAYEEARGASSLLLADVSATHTAPVTRDEQIRGDGVPDQRALDLAIDALAAFHACWWGRPELGEVFPAGGWYGGAEQFAAHMERRRGEWARFLAAEGAWFPADLRAIYEEAFTRAPHAWAANLGARLVERRAVTLSQGDCYLTQFLVPRAGVAAPTYLIDFQGVAADCPAFDLAHMFAAAWTRQQRQEDDRELRCLRRYHAGLLAGGVHDYSWDDLLADYRALLAIMLFYPVWDETNGSPQGYWLPKMRCLVAAYQDHCLA